MATAERIDPFRAFNFTVYIDGSGNVVQGCSIERGLTSYVYPNSTEQARYAGCVDAQSGSAIAIP